MPLSITRTALVLCLAGAVLAAPAAGQAQRKKTRLAGTANQPTPLPGKHVGTWPVNAPVAPDTIYVARTFPRSGVSVIDLNGFGQSTGTPYFDILYGPASEGLSAFLWNPNVAFQGSLLIPPLAPGTTTLDGGSRGVFTLTQDTSLDDVLLEEPSIRSVSDMMLGSPLDVVFNNGVSFGCQQGSGNICASTGLQVLSVAHGGPYTLVPALPTQIPQRTVVGAGNPISFAPHPNPPPRALVPLCGNPPIPGQEPTSVMTSLAPPGGNGLQNLLVPGPRPLGDPLLGIPPQNTLSAEQNAFFQGPLPSQSSPVLCAPYMIRQQIGHFLYVADPARAEIVVVNSNTFETLGRIAVADPCELAMDPNLRFLALTSRANREVVFIDIQPESATFHQIVKRTAVGAGPCGIAWEGGGEDLLVCNEDDDTVSIISGFDLNVRKTLTGLDAPFAVAVTPRQSGYGLARNVYFAYVLQRSGAVALFESGPSGINGWGHDDIIGITSFAFPNPRAIQPDHWRLTSGVWIAHETKLDANGGPLLGGGAVSNLVIDASPTGLIPLQPGETPSLRGITFRIESSIGSDVLTGTPRDLAFDDQRNLGALENFTSLFSPGVPAPINGKSLVRRDLFNVVRQTNAPRLMFLPVTTSSGTQSVDVIDLVSSLRIDTNPFQSGVQSIPAEGAVGVMDYFRQ